MARDFEDRLEQYLRLARERPDLFANPPGGVRVLMDPAEMKAVEAQARVALRDSNFPEEGAEVGMVLRDPWFSVLRDAVAFPDGSRGTYGRIVGKHRDASAVLARVGDTLVLIRHFRHALRRSILEIPRGGVEAGDTPEGTARQELAEEIGGVIRRLEPLGTMYGMSSLHGNRMHLYYAELESLGEPNRAEGIEAVERHTVPQFERLIAEGELQDGFALAAFCHARLRKLV